MFITWYIKQTPSAYLRGQRCPSCYGCKKLTSTEFIDKAIIIHGDKYDYSHVQYVNSQTKVKILCKEHCIFYQTPNKHMSGKGCKECGFISSSLKQRFTLNLFVNKCTQVHKDRYLYNNVIYFNNRTKIKIICRDNGEFEQTPYDHLSGYGCQICG